MYVQYEICYNANILIRAKTRTIGSHDLRQVQCVCVRIRVSHEETGLKQSAQRGCIVAHDLLCARAVCKEPKCIVGHAIVL